VTLNGDVKLLDFGIAKLFAEDGLAKTLPKTNTAMGIMTPEYASRNRRKKSSRACAAVRSCPSNTVGVRILSSAPNTKILGVWCQISSDS
jgi:serine/threonine protein kinase